MNQLETGFLEALPEFGPPNKERAAFLFARRRLGGFGGDVLLAGFAILKAKRSPS